MTINARASRNPACRWQAVLARWATLNKGLTATERYFSLELNICVQIWEGDELITLTPTRTFAPARPDKKISKRE